MRARRGALGALRSRRKLSKKVKKCGLFKCMVLRALWTRSAENGNVEGDRCPPRASGGAPAARPVVAVFSGPPRRRNSHFRRVTHCARIGVCGRPGRCGNGLESISSGAGAARGSGAPRAPPASRSSFYNFYFSPSYGCLSMCNFCVPCVRGGRASGGAGGLGN